MGNAFLQITTKQDLQNCTIRCFALLITPPPKKNEQKRNN